MAYEAILPVKEMNYLLTKDEFIKEKFLKYEVSACTWFRVWKVISKLAYT
jgi:hypothetical protein